MFVTALLSGIAAIFSLLGTLLAAVFGISMASVG